MKLQLKRIFVVMSFAIAFTSCSSDDSNSETIGKLVVEFDNVYKAANFAFNTEYTNSNGENYFAYTIPLSELMVVMPDGSEITQNLYEKRKAEAPKEQQTLSVFPNFEDEFIPKLKDVSLDEEESASDILLRIATEFQKLATKLK
jgi:hypothetical protein